MMQETPQSNLAKRWKWVQAATIVLFLLLMALVYLGQPEKVFGIDGLVARGYLISLAAGFFPVIIRFWGTHRPLERGGKWLFGVRVAVDAAAMGCAALIWTGNAAWLALKTTEQLYILKIQGQWIFLASLGFGIAFGAWLSIVLQKRLGRYREAMVFGLGAFLNFLFSVGSVWGLYLIEEGMPYSQIRSYGPMKTPMAAMALSSLIACVGMAVYLAFFRRRYLQDLRLKMEAERSGIEEMESH